MVLVRWDPGMRLRSTDSVLTISHVHGFGSHSLGGERLVHTASTICVQMMPSQQHRQPTDACYGMTCVTALMM